MFLFSPLEKVIIVAYGLDVPGRVQACTLDVGNVITYTVEYALDGSIRGSNFFEDELVKVQ